MDLRKLDWNSHLITDLSENRNKILFFGYKVQGIELNQTGGFKLDQIFSKFYDILRV
ncbi:hypothetical protein [Leptospira stimsonii]|uniref:hypothetical protein n=1 Tax=Leptospira stimsonii TaxID=2202203 RepID=UPI001F508D18|nr:hypothetical protein [Leptospira stimsonii]